MPGVGFHHKYRQAGLEGALAQLRDAAVDLVTAGQQDGTNLYAVHCGETGGHQHVGTVRRGHQQRAGTEMLQHMRQAARAEGYRLDAARGDLAFVDHFGIEVAAHIDGARGDQIEAPGHAAQHRQGAVGEQLFRIDVGDARFGGVVENFRQIRTRAALFIHRGVQLVDDNAGDIFILAAAEAALRQFNTLFQLGGRVVAQRHNKHDLGVKRPGDLIVERVGELMLTRRHQAFNQHDFRIFGVFVVARDDLFHQHVLLVSAQQRLHA